MKKNNKKILNDAESGVKEEISFVLHDGMNRHLSIIEKYQSYIKEISVLSLAILGVVMPLVYQSNPSYYIKIATLFFFLNALLGFLYILYIFRHDIIHMPNVIDKQTEKGFEILKEIRRIHNVEDNNTAGRMWEELLASNELKDKSETAHCNKLNFIFRRFFNVEVWFFAFFVLGLISLFLGIFI